MGTITKKGRQRMNPELSNILLATIACTLLVLILRFVQPELIYGLRQALVKVQTNKAFLDYEAGRPGTDVTFQSLLIQDFRYETVALDEEYVFHRVDKIRELYRLLDSRRQLLSKDLSRDQQPQVCIVELAALLGSLGRQITPLRRYHQPVVSGRGVLIFIANEIRKSQMEPPLTSDQSVSDWFNDNPLSIEQTIELLIAAAYGLSLRQRATTREASLVTTRRPAEEALLVILKTEKRLRFFVRGEYARRYKAEQDRSDRVRAALGDDTYNECVRKMEASRSKSRGLALDFFDFLYFANLETLIFGEWESFRPLFKEKVWLKQRIEKIIQVRNELAHGRAPGESLISLALGYCGEIEERLAV